VKRLTWRIALATTALVLVCCTIAAFNAGMRHWQERQVRGRLSFDANLQNPLTLQTGSFEINWNPEQGGVIFIVHPDHAGGTVWETIPACAFVGAALGDETVTEHRGMFSFRDRIRKRYPHQHITQIRQEGTGMAITGYLGATPGSRDVAYTFALQEHASGRLGFTLEVDEITANRSYITCASTSDEDFFGFGEQCTHFNLKGRRVPIFVMEQGIGRGRQPLTFLVDLVAKAGGAWYTSYISVPHYITSAMHSLFLETHAYAVFDLRKPDSVQVSLFASTMKGSILAGDSPATLISRYTEATGRMRALPDWILEGAVIGVQGGTEKVQRVWESLRQHETPVTAFWLQDWVGQRRTVVGKQLWWNWELDRDHYPHWEELVADWKAADIRVMTYINPFLIDPSAKGQYNRNLFQEAADRGFLVKNTEGNPYLVKNTDFSAAMVDLAQSEARDWMKAVITDQVIGVGASGWMADFGEALPYDAVLDDNISGNDYHNQYPEAWAQLNREVIEETGTGDNFVFFMRSGYRESPRHSTLFWLGDQMVTWDQYDGIKSAVTGLLSSGMSGFAFNHSDIGGYTAITLPVFPYVRDKELLLRWMELNAFSVIFRTHEGIAPEANHQFYSDEESLAQFSRCARIYAAWAPYRKQLVQESAATGMPVVRHPFLHYPKDPRVRAMSYEQFLVGDAFMIIPVLDAGSNSVRCYLPEGQWIHLWSEKEYTAGREGLQMLVDASIGKPAVFCKPETTATKLFLENLKKVGVLEGKTKRVSTKK
jgi:sulfoquinovosidase